MFLISVFLLAAYIAVFLFFEVPHLTGLGLWAFMGR